jgi:hypothetical protein
MQRVFELAGLLVFLVLREPFSKTTLYVEVGLPFFGATLGSLLALAIPLFFSSP